MLARYRSLAVPLAVVAAAVLFYMVNPWFFPAVGSTERGIATVAFWVLMIAVLVAGVTLLSAVLPDYRGAVQLRNPVPLDEEFANLNRVSHWPADWINAVCEPPLYQTPKLGAIASHDEYRVLRVTDQVRRRRGLSHDLSFSW